MSLHGENVLGSRRRSHVSISIVMDSLCQPNCYGRLLANVCQLPFSSQLVPGLWGPLVFIVSPFVGVGRLSQPRLFQLQASWLVHKLHSPCKFCLCVGSCMLRLLCYLSLTRQ